MELELPNSVPLYFLSSLMLNNIFMNSKMITFHAAQVFFNKTTIGSGSGPNLTLCGSCVNGFCVPPGICSCQSGWDGAFCDVGEYSGFTIYTCKQSYPEKAGVDV